MRVDSGYSINQIYESNDWSPQFLSEWEEVMVLYLVPVEHQSLRRVISIFVLLEELTTWINRAISVKASNHATQYLEILPCASESSNAPAELMKCKNVFLVQHSQEVMGEYQCEQKKGNWHYKAKGGEAKGRRERGGRAGGTAEGSPG